MTQVKSISLSKFTSSVQAAVKAAMRNHPKFKIDAPNSITFAHLIRGIPVPDLILKNVTFGETQAFANEIAAQISGVHPEVFAAPKGAAGQGAILSVGHHVILGIPAAPETINLTK
jgi:hypothetical protein